MIHKTFNPDSPIVIGLYGKACAGKTATASKYVPDAVLTKGLLQWDNLTFAAPLYEMVSVIRQIEGSMRKDRIKYAIHEILVDLFSRSPLYGAPPYIDLTTIVQEIASQPLPDGKPRDFMQYVGTLCRSYDEDCFVKNMKRKIMTGGDLIDTDSIYCVIIDDVRMENEAAMIANLPNGMVIELTASPEVRAKRAYDRDGFVMTEEQASHHTETATIPRELITATIDTDHIDVEETAMQVSSVLYDTLKGLWDFAKVS